MSRGSQPQRRPGQTYRMGVSPAQHLNIGRAIDHWSRIENLMQEVIWALLNVSVEEGRIITSRLDAKFRRMMMLSLAERYMTKGTFKIFKDLVNKKVSTLYDTRNLIAHGNWVTILPDNVPAVLSLREKSGDLLPDEVIFTRIDFAQMQKDANDIFTALLSLCNQLRASHHKSNPPNDTR